MAKKYGNGGGDLLLQMFEEVVAAREGLKRTEAALTSLGRGLLKLRGVIKAHDRLPLEDDRRLSALEPARER